MAIIVASVAGLCECFCWLGEGGVEEAWRGRCGRGSWVGEGGVEEAWRGRRGISSNTHLVSQTLHHVRPRPRVSHPADARLFLENELRVARNPCRRHCGQTQGLVKCVGVQRLSSTKRRSHGFNGRSDDVVVRVLLRKRHTRCLRMRAKQARLGVLRSRSEVNDARACVCA
jgi:hypothetical protein